MEQNLKKDFIWNTIGNLATVISGFLIIVITTRVLGIEISGVYTFSLTFVAVFTTISNFGGTVYQITDTSSEFESQHYLFAKCVSTAFSIIIAIPYILLNNLDPLYLGITMVTLFTTSFASLESPLLAILQTNHHLYQAGIILGGKAISNLLLFSILIYTTHNLVVACISLLLVAIFFFLFIEYPSARKFERIQLLHLNYKSELSYAFHTLRKNLWIFLFGFLGSFVNLCPRLFIEHYHPQLQGFLGIILIPMSLVMAISSYFFNPLLVPMSNQYKRKEFKQLNSTIVRVCLICFGLGIILIPAIWFLAQPLYQLVFAVDIGAYLNELLIVDLIGVLVMINGIFVSLLQIARKLKTPVVLIIVQLAVSVLVGLILVPQYQLLGALISFGSGIAIWVIIAILIYFSHQKTQANLITKD